MKKITKLLIAFSLFGSFVLTSCAQPSQRRSRNSSDELQSSIESELTSDIQEVTVVSISVKEKSVPEYIFINEFDNAGLKLIVNYSNSTKKEIGIDSSMLTAQSKEDIKSAGEKTITIQYEGKTTTVRIVIAPKNITVNFYSYIDTNEYTLVDTQTIGYKQNAVAPTVIDDFYYGNKHYYFNDWDKSYRELKTNTDVYALYDAINYYTVTFVDGNGNEISTQKVDEGRDAIRPAEQLYSISGYTFVGWDRSYLNVTGNITVYGLYKKIESDIITTSITLEEGKSLLIGANLSYTLEFTTNHPESDTTDLVWRSSNPAVASVDNGVITSHIAGTTIISVENNYAKSSVALTVKDIISNRNHPLSAQDAKALLDRCRETNTKIAQKIHITGSVSQASYVWPYNIDFNDEDHRIILRIPVTLDDSLIIFNNAVGASTLSVECWAYSDKKSSYRFGISELNEDNTINWIEAPLAYDATYPPFNGNLIIGVFKNGNCINYTDSTCLVSIDTPNTPLELHGIASPTNSSLTEDLQWTVENPDVIRIETSGHHKYYCHIYALSTGTSKVTLSYGEVSKEVNIVVGHFGTEEAPLTVSQYTELCSLYGGARVSRCYVQGTVTKVVAKACTLSDENDVTITMTNSNDEIKLNSVTTLLVYTLDTSLSDGTNVIKERYYDVISSVGGIQREVIPVSLSEAFEIAHVLAKGEQTYHYYEITGYVAYKVDTRYVYLCETPDVYESEPNHLENFVLYKIINYLPEDQLVYGTKIKVVTTLTNYNDNYFENGYVKEATIAEIVKTTDLIVEQDAVVVENEVVNLVVTAYPSKAIVTTEAKYSWVDDSQTVAEINEQGAVSGLHPGEATLKIEFDDFVKEYLIKVYSLSEIPYEKCMDMPIDGGTYLIVCDRLNYKAIANNTDFSVLEYHMRIDRTANLFGEAYEWVFDKVEQDGQTYYTIKSVSSNQYIKVSTYDSHAYFSDYGTLFKVEVDITGRVDIMTTDETPLYIYHHRTLNVFTVKEYSSSYGLHLFLKK